MLLIKFLIAKLRQLRRYMRKEVDNIKSPSMLKAYATLLKKRIDAEKAKDSL